jgi:hypothetical protein
MIRAAVKHRPLVRRSPALGDVLDEDSMREPRGRYMLAPARRQVPRRAVQEDPVFAEVQSKWQRPVTSFYALRSIDVAMRSGGTSTYNCRRWLRELAALGAGVAVAGCASATASGVDSEGAARSAGDHRTQSRSGRLAHFNGGSRSHATRRSRTCVATRCWRRGRTRGLRCGP